MFRVPKVPEPFLRRAWVYDKPRVLMPGEYLLRSLAGFPGFLRQFETSEFALRARRGVGGPMFHLFETLPAEAFMLFPVSEDRHKVVGCLVEAQFAN